MVNNTTNDNTAPRALGDDAAQYLLSALDTCLLNREQHAGWAIAAVHLGTLVATDDQPLSVILAEATVPLRRLAQYPPQPPDNLAALVVVFDTLTTIDSLTPRDALHRAWSDAIQATDVELQASEVAPPPDVYGPALIAARWGLLSIVCAASPDVRTAATRAHQLMRYHAPSWEQTS